MSWFMHPKLKNCRRIFLKNIRRQMFIGAYEHEKKAAQLVIINIELYVTTDNELDDLSNAYNYDKAIEIVDEVIQSPHIALQETLIDRISEQLLKDYRVRAVLVRSEKPQAYDTADSAGVEIFRIRNV
mgnify:CR=1 FL=1